MCVTNTTLRRTIQPITFRPPELIVQQQQKPFEFYCDGSADSSFVVVVPPPAAVSEISTTTTAVVAEKAKTKRRRKPQKPGKTAKNQERHFVVHNYHDHSVDSPEDVDSSDSGATSSEDHHQHRRRGGVAVSFPLKLHSVLDQIALDGLDHVISWQPHGRAFAIHQPKVFTEQVMPKYFRQSKLTSFQRQLNLYGFQRLTRGADAGAYYCELFLRGMPFLCKKMIRTKVKGTRYKAASSPEQEPNFYTMPPVSPDYLPSSRRGGDVTPSPPSSPTQSTHRTTQYNEDDHPAAGESWINTSTTVHDVPPAVAHRTTQYNEDDHPAAGESWINTSTTVHDVPPAVADYLPSVTAVSSSSFGFDDDIAVSPESFEPIPWEPQPHASSDSNMIDETFEIDELSQASDFCMAWDTDAVDLEIQAALESDDKLEEMIERLLED